MTEYPEHEKLKRVAGAADTIGNFLGWLQSTGTFLARYRGDVLVPIYATPPTRLLAEYFEIDLDKLEKEKEHMLQTLRGEG